MDLFIAKIKSMGAMAIAIWVSVLVHAVLLSLHFQPELKKFADSMPTLEVMLVNAKSSTMPEKADVLAQANLDKGGNTDLDRQMRTPMPALNQQKTEVTLDPSTQTENSDSTAEVSSLEAKQQQNLDKLEKQSQELLTQLKAINQVESQVVKKAAAKVAETGNQESPSKQLDTNKLAAMALEIDRQEAIISKSLDENQKRPKRKFIGSRAKEYKYAMYVDAWRQKVEKIGNLNYPEAAKDQKLYGELQMTVSIRQDGSIENIELNHSSGHKLLDEAAKHIVELGAPYPRFSDEISKEIDVLSITRTWTFTKDDNMSSE